ncbi:hypothetical protein [Rubrimonas cliftonensis]|uniref:Uncharacterized protein n=1 Tax=Rubrimonas cliftonensis TaxID=89524 RepID=A0A1H3X9Q2_9RHOB|nr:hypothetical protein [Rubrimonas cliftonensis]SDZ96126.1 hypothetical protein SAMN05444370_102335 [Rubrimonas cliftonensis]
MSAPPRSAMRAVSRERMALAARRMIAAEARLARRFSGVFG